MLLRVMKKFNIYLYFNLILVTANIFYTNVHFITKQCLNPRFVIVCEKVQLNSIKDSDNKNVSRIV